MLNLHLIPFHSPIIERFRNLFLKGKEYIHMKKLIFVFIATLALAGCDDDSKLSKAIARIPIVNNAILVIKITIHLQIR